MKIITFNGYTMNLREWSAFIGISEAALSYRLRKGWPLQRALTLKTLPADQRCTFSATRITHAGERLTIEEWAVRLGIAPASVHKRLKSGMPPAEAVSKPRRAYPARGRGMVSDLQPLKGTGAGSDAQERSEIEISEKPPQ